MIDHAVLLDARADTFPDGLAGTPFETVYLALRMVAADVWDVDPQVYRAAIAWGWYLAHRPADLAGFRDVLANALVSSAAPMVKGTQTAQDLAEYLRQWREYLPTFGQLEALYSCFAAEVEILPIIDPESQSVIPVEDTRLAFYVRIVGVDFSRPLSLAEAYAIALRATPMGSRPVPYYAIGGRIDVPARPCSGISGVLRVPRQPLAALPLFDFLTIDSAGKITGGAAYDGILTFPTTYHTIDDDTQVIFVAVEQRTISFINTEHPEFDVPLPATISQDYGSTATLPSVSGTYEDADYTYTPSAWSIGAFGASITLRNNLLAVLLWDETPIVPVGLPTVSNNDFLLSNGERTSSNSAYIASSSGRDRTISPNEQIILCRDTNRVVDYVSENSNVYATYNFYSYTEGASVIACGKLELVINELGRLTVKNISGATLHAYYARIYSCSSDLATVVTVYNSSNVAYNAFKYTANNTDYYYVLDGTQTDWTDDLSSIGYGLYQEVTLYCAGGRTSFQTKVTSSSSPNSRYVQQAYTDSSLTQAASYDSTKRYEKGYYSDGEWVVSPLQSIENMPSTVGSDYYGMIPINSSGLMKFWFVSNKNASSQYAQYSEPDDYIFRIYPIS